MSQRPANRLAKETSPYLLQHANNPVDWYPWGPEALERAKREDKPIFLSVGYAACHWCHVMERECFEDEEVAKALNASFVAVKVDREERPDIDALYMTATVAMSGSGGWPMSVFLTPDGRPFFAGTYFPKSSKHGRPGFTDILGRIAQLWRESKDELVSQADELLEAVRAEAALEPPRGIDAAAEQRAAERLLADLDQEWGGFGRAPKFPSPFALSLLLRQHHASGSQALLDAVLLTLDRMARGGIYDHVGGGFARYSTDEKWHVPHFEKMLYDNAQLARVYVEAYQVTRAPELRRVAEETLDYVIREMQGEHGGYFSATDADSEGEEGRFFVWPHDEIIALLPEDEAAAVIAAYDVRPRGNWEGHNVLWMPLTLDEVAKGMGVGPAVLAGQLASAQKTLYEARKKRIAPLLDDKVLVSWNALMIGTMAFASRALGEPRFLHSAERAADMIRARMGAKDGKLLRTYRAGRAHIDGFLEDYAFLADALIDLYETSGRYDQLAESLRLAEHAALSFVAEDGLSFCTTGDQHEALVVRMRESTDNATPSANAVLARALARLAAHFGRDDLRSRAEGAIRAHGRAISKHPRAFTTSLEVVSRLVAPPLEVALVGSPGDAALIALDRALGDTYLPSLVISRLDPATEAAPRHPLLAGKALVDGKPAAYVCKNFACHAPVTSADELARELREATARSASEKRPALEVPRVASSATAEATGAFVRGAQPGSSGPLLEYVVHRAGLLVAAYREDQAAEVVQLALDAGRNLIAFDPQRASAVGDALEGPLREGQPKREALVLVGVLPELESTAGALGTARELAADARLERLDLLLVPWVPASAERLPEALSALREVGVATHLGLLLEEPLDDETIEQLGRLPSGSFELVSAPFNLLEGDPTMPAKLAAKGWAHLALRALDARFGNHVVQFGDMTTPGDLPPAPPLASALGELSVLEAEFRKTIAVHLRVQGDADIDPNELLRWSEELGKAERSLDDALEVQAFVAQSVAPALQAQWGALASIGGELAPRVESLRDRYLTSFDKALKAMARRVVTRQAAFAKTFSDAIAGSNVGAVAGLALGAVLHTPGVGAALVSARIGAHVETTSSFDAPQQDLFAKARAVPKPPAAPGRP